MKFLKRSERQKPRVSLVLLDWRVRESIHLLHYLKTQTAPRDTFEVIVVEYYDYHSSAVKKFESEIDTWVLLQMPDDCYYHKHLMYNAGVVLSRGDIVMFGDSDAMVRPTFIEQIIASFDKESLLAYHMDEFRNVRRDLYPFNYPSFEDVLGDGCINNVGGKTKGVLDDIDPIHTRNYGACMCARREDIIGIGGADEDLTYLGHICGPYDMTFRLMNYGRRLFWETEEYLYHTWHPGTDGADNYLGPHDGRNMSTTALQALSTGRVRPLVENEAIRALRTRNESSLTDSELLGLLINPDYEGAFRKTGLGRTGMGSVQGSDRKTETVFATYKGFDVYRIDGTFYAVPEALGKIDPKKLPLSSDDRITAGQSFSEIREDLDSGEARLLETSTHANICAVGSRYAVVSHSLGAVDFRIRKHRSDSRIRWANTLAEARDLASRTAEDVVQTKTRNNGEMTAPRPNANGVPFLAEHMSEINRRLTQVETQVSAIQNSRIWRTLVRIGGVIDKIRGRGRKSSTWYENSSRVRSASGASQNR